MYVAEVADSETTCQKKTSVDDESSQAVFFWAMEMCQEPWFSSKRETVSTTNLDSTFYFLKYDIILREIWSLMLFLTVPPKTLFIPSCLRSDFLSELLGN